MVSYALMNGLKAILLLIYLLFMLEHFVMDSDLVIAHALSFIWFVGLMGADLGPAFLIKLLVLCLVDF